jgi:hypothetical protein
LPYLLADGESLTVIIRFAPPDFSFWDGALRITTDSPVTPSVEVKLKGFGDFPPPNPSFPLTSCGGICRDTAIDINNCGGCGVVCPPPEGGVAECIAGVCGWDCGADDKVSCSGVCRDISADPNNCGACGFVCPEPVGGTAYCADYQCYEDCGSLTACGGTCADLSSSLSHCGWCGNVCPPPPAYATAACEGGTCGFICNAGYVQAGDLCVPEEEDPRQLLEELIAFYLDSIWNRTIVGRGGPLWARAFNQLIIWRDLFAALWNYGLGNTERTCYWLEEVQKRADGLPRPPDSIEGPGTEELLLRIEEITIALGCP